MATEDWPQAGAVVLDTNADRVGVVLGSNRGTVSLRPAGGGTPWNVRRDAVRPASPLDELRAKVAEINARRTWCR
ncbi:hypothetical protein [Streptantibioticus ferralitis]|uniref:Uncharacterized protein n=1 Tax=Streptantibioticus ferralitis TaxID=236510 RepID=A0ABT5YXT5_9ACTN|nr:hypothetical protein [Streptantibioticus ferralitis]MDF2256402.1 hypothetical protein [Streptantibioticus ferralitis]